MLTKKLFYLLIVLSGGVISGIGIGSSQTFLTIFGILCLGMFPLIITGQNKLDEQYFWTRKQMGGIAANAIGLMAIFSTITQKLNGNLPNEKIMYQNGALTIPEAIFIPFCGVILITLGMYLMFNNNKKHTDKD